jgi:hypothetical protein
LGVHWLRLKFSLTTADRNNLVGGNYLICLPCSLGGCEGLLWNCNQRFSRLIIGCLLQFPLSPQGKMMPTDENAIGDRAGGGSAVDHGNNPPSPGGMDLSGDGHVPKVSQRLTSTPVDPPRISAPSPCSDQFLAPTFPPTRRGSRTRSRSSGRSGRRTSTGGSWRRCSYTAAPGAAYKVREGLFSWWRAS